MIHVVPAERPAIAPDPYASARAYFDGLQPREKMETELRGRQILHNAAGTGFEAINPDHITVIPVLISEEDPAQVEKTLDMLRAAEEYAGVRGWTVLSANMPIGQAPSDNTNRVLQQIKRYQQKYPEFGLSFFEQQYKPGTRIGTILRDLYGAAIAAYTSGQNDVRNVPLLRCDADMVNIPQDIFVQLGKELNELGSQATNWLLHPTIVHERLGEDSPRYNSLLAWYDAGESANRALTDMCYAVDLIGYCEADGVPAESAIQEVYRLRNRMGKPTVRRMQTTLVTSSRHLVSRASSNGPFDYDRLTTPSKWSRSYRGKADMQPRRDAGRGYYRAQLLPMIRRFLTAQYSLLELQAERGDSAGGARKEVLQELGRLGSQAIERNSSHSESDRRFAMRSLWWHVLKLRVRTALV